MVQSSTKISRVFKSVTRVRFTLRLLFAFFIAIAMALSFKPSLSVSSRMVDVGNVEVDQVYHAKFLVKNVGWYSLKIEPTSCSCGSTFEQMDPFFLKSGESREIFVSFHLFRVRRLGRFSKEFRISTNDQFQRHVVVEATGVAVAN